MEKPEIAQKAPYIMEVSPGKYWWCACGKSSKQPYCDGSHKGSGISPVMEEFSETTRVAWCGCKQSNKGVRCDGTHKQL